MKLLRAATCLAWLVVCVAGATRDGSAQTLPSEPIAFGDGRLTIGGDVAASIGSADLGFFNYSDYNHSTLRLFRLDVSAAVAAGGHPGRLPGKSTAKPGRVRAHAF